MKHDLEVRLSGRTIRVYGRIEAVLTLVSHLWRERLLAFSDDMSGSVDYLGGVSARYLAVVAAVLVHVAGAAWADTVVLKDGQKFEGVVTKAGETVEVKLDVGTISFPASEVAKIIKSDTPVHTFERRLAAIRSGDVAALMKLAEWARANGLSNRAYSTYRRVLTIDEDHAGARRALGHVRKAGVWVDPEEEQDKARAAALSERAKAVRAQRSSVRARGLDSAPPRAKESCPPPSRFGRQVKVLREGTSLFVWTQRFHPQQKCKARRN